MQEDGLQKKNNQLSKKHCLPGLCVFLALFLSFSPAMAGELAIIVSNNNQGELESCG